MKRLKDIRDMNSSVERLWPAVEADRSDRAHPVPSPSAGQQDVADLHVALEEINLAFEKANRRINRLQGEKNQLAALLEKRDEQIERLNRELGGYVSSTTFSTKREARISETRGPFAGAFRSMAEGVGALFAHWRTADDGASAESRSSDINKSKPPRLAARRGGDAEQPVVGVVLFGLARDEVERLLPIVERDCSSRGMKPLCLVDVDAFELLRARGLIFEYLPPMDERDRFDRSLHWDLYIQRRLAIVRRKWNPVRVIAFGGSAMKTLRLWSSSPFEDKPLPAVLVGAHQA